MTQENFQCGCVGPGTTISYMLRKDPLVTTLLVMDVSIGTVQE